MTQPIDLDRRRRDNRRPEISHLDWPADALTVDIDRHLVEIAAIMNESGDQATSNIGNDLGHVAAWHRPSTADCRIPHPGTPPGACPHYLNAVAVAVSWYRTGRPAEIARLEAQQRNRAAGIAGANMPDQCHDHCGSHSGLYYPFTWLNGVATYQCEHGHTWACGWGHDESGSCPANRARRQDRWHNETSEAPLS